MRMHESMSIHGMVWCETHSVSRCENAKREVNAGAHRGASRKYKTRQNDNSYIF